MTHLAIDFSSFTMNATGDVCAGDTILFAESVFGGSFRKPRFLGERQIAARVVKDSYGCSKQQHTFTLFVIGSTGHDPLPGGTTTTRKGRNVYRNGCSRRPWADEAARKAALADKHDRGDAARAIRDERRLCEARF